MELVPTTIAVGWASGLNAYGTTLVLCLLGRAGITEVPDDLTTNPILIGLEGAPDRGPDRVADMDKYAQRSQELAVKSQEDGFFDREIVPVTATSPS